MSTYRQIVFMIQDELKLVSDDSYYTWDHFRFLVNKFRALLLKKTYGDSSEEVPSSDYQMLCLSLEEVDMSDGDPCADGTALRSTVKLPDTIDIGTVRVHTQSKFSCIVTFVSQQRFEHIGFNRFTQNFIYAAEGPDGYLYLRSQNPQFRYLENVRVDAIFEDPEKASDYECTEDGETVSCNILDREFPLEENLVPTLIEMVVKELSGYVYQPKDTRNNASDDLSELANFVRSHLKNIDNGAGVQ